ncbi:MAG: PEP-CTERM sorting domain-containing protein [Myxococcota bacterium]
MLLAPSLAQAVAIGGVDAQSQYTGYTPVVGDSGVFTFEDTLNGTNPSPEPGTVTTADAPGLAGLIGGAIDLEIMLDTSGFNPAAGNLLDASFLGTGAAPEIIIWDSPARNTVLLALDVDFVNVTQILPAFPPFIPCCGSFTIGQPEVSSYGVQSQLQVVGGTFAAAAGGIGTGATLQIFISDPVPTLDNTNVNSFLNDDFTVGFNVNPSSEVTWEINFVPEPGTTLLACSGLAGLAMAGRSRRR